MESDPRDRDDPGDPLETVSLPVSHYLTATFPDTPPSFVHLSLQYYSDVIAMLHPESPAWIPKFLRRGGIPLPIVARRPFEAPASPARLLSSKCDSPYLRLREILEEKPDAAELRGLIADMQAYTPPPIAADSFLALCAAVFEAYVEICDALDVCNTMSDFVDGVDTDGEWMRHRLEELEIRVRRLRSGPLRLNAKWLLINNYSTVFIHVQLRDRAIYLHHWISLLAPISRAVAAVRSSSLSSWSSDWHIVMDELQPLAASYMTLNHAVTLVPVICKSVIDPLPQLCSLTSLSTEDLGVELSRVRERMMAALPEQYHSTMSSVHGVYHNFKYILGVSRFESRLEVFSRLEDCVDHLDGVVSEFKDILQSHRDFCRTNHILDISKIDVIARHLQETEVRLHDAELRAMRFVESHVDSLASFKRGAFISSSVGGSKAMTSILVPRGMSRLQMAVSRKNHHRGIKGMSSISASLARNRHLALVATNLAAFHQNEEIEERVRAVLHDLDEENSRLHESICSACTNALGKLVCEALASDITSSWFTALSNAWVSRSDASMQCILKRYQRLRAYTGDLYIDKLDEKISFETEFIFDQSDLPILLSVRTDFPVVQAELPETATAFREELAAISQVGIRSTISSADVDDFIRKYGDVKERIHNLGEVLRRHRRRAGQLCRQMGEALATFKMFPADALTSSIPFSQAIDILLDHVRGIIQEFGRAKDALILEAMAELVGVRDESYKSRLETSTSDALTDAVKNFIRRFAEELFIRNDMADQDVSTAPRIVLVVPTIEHIGAAVREVLSRIVKTINGLKSCAFISLEDVLPVDDASVMTRGNAQPEIGRLCPDNSADMSRSSFTGLSCHRSIRSRCSDETVHEHRRPKSIRVSAWLVVEITQVTGDRGAPESSGVVISSDVQNNENIQHELERRYETLRTRIQSVVTESAELQDAIMGHINSTKEELAPRVTTVVSDTQERAWMLEEAADRLVYEFEVLLKSSGGNAHGMTTGSASLMLPPRGAHDELIRLLRTKVFQTEQELLDDLYDMEARSALLKSNMDWIKDIHEFSTVDLDAKLSAQGLTLDQCVDQTENCASLVPTAREMAAIFDGSNAANSLDSVIRLQSVCTVARELTNHLESFSEMVDQFTAMPWDKCSAEMANILRFVSEHQEHVHSLEKSAGSWAMFREYSTTVSKSTKSLELMSTMCAAPLKDRHWKVLGSLCPGIAPEAAPSPSNVWALILSADDGVGSEIAAIEDLVALAVREGKLRDTFDAIKDRWMSTVIELAPYKSKGAIFLESSVSADIMDDLEDSILTLGSMASNRASQHFREEIKDILRILSNVEEGMQLWLSTQSVWSYMEAVFDGGEITAQLPSEAARFADIDARYLNIVRRVTDNPHYADFFSGDDKREAFVQLLSDLEMCQKGLSAYLESKRKIFPRFYFVSDSTLLEILSHGSNPRAVQVRDPTAAGDPAIARDLSIYYFLTTNTFSKSTITILQMHFQAGIFDGIDRLVFASDASILVTHMVSKEGESVELRTPVSATGSAEIWLINLVDSMRETMRYEARRAAKEIHKMPVEDFLFSRPAQMALLGLQLKWTADVQAALHRSSRGKKGALKKLLVEYEAMLSRLIELTLCNDLSPVQRTSLETCITVFIHQKDVIEELIHKRVLDPKSFDWLKHCRFRWREDKGSLFVSICDNEFEYGYEYLGVKERLVMTPLTDICYIALTQAVGMNCGGAPAGPAGTGKTETTKDLGNTLGRYVVVFNCSDQMDHHMMGRIFKGLAQAGFWGCFDEFNRINLDVLSVCAQQLDCIFTALKERKNTVTFIDGDSIPLNRDVGYFITMNPGYAGRQELPENLKALFRGVTMMAPDRRIIMKVKLAAVGFQDSDLISRKFDRLYTLCEQQLTNQPHYDFGLRNILSVLRTAGAAKRANPMTEEMVLMMKTLHDMNVSKFVAEDVQTFAALMQDVFPRVSRAPPSKPTFYAALKETCEEVGWSYHADWAEKCLQLYESSLVRHGIMVVGPSRSGKSTTIDAVARTLTLLGKKTSVWRMNPKSITAPQMFGKLDQSTGDWTEGVFSQLWKKAARTSHAVWIVVDGPVDAVWIENLNTVLDDNKVLTLANGDRVRMMPSMRLVFETENLNNASPATVSRAGVVFLSPSVLGWRPIAESYIISNGFLSIRPWLSGLVEASLEALISIGSEMPISSHNSAPRSSAVPLKIGEVALMESFTAYLDGLLARHATLAEALRQSDRSKDEPYVLDTGVKHALLFCAAWGFGGILPRASRAVFSARLKERFGDLLAFVPHQGSIHDFLYDVEATVWKPWVDLMDEVAPIPGWLGSVGSSALCEGLGVESDAGSSKLRSSTEFDTSSFVVCSPEETRCRYLIDLLLKVGKIPHLVGPRGTGKTTITRQYCDQHHQAHGIQARTFVFSALTSPQMFYDSLNSCLEKRQGCNYGPIGGRSMIFILDDISMPQPNQWGDQATNELMRQLFELDGFYRLTKPIGEFNTVGDVSYVAASRHDGDMSVPNRLSGIMQTIYVDNPTEADVAHIVDRMIRKFISIFGLFEENAVLLRKLGKLAVKICYTMARTLSSSTDAARDCIDSGSLGTPKRFHYEFGMRQPCEIVRFLLSKLNTSRPIESDGEVVRLFAHECRRELIDMLVSYNDIQNVSGIIDACIKEGFAAVPAPTFFSSTLASEDLERKNSASDPSFMSPCAAQSTALMAPNRSSVALEATMGRSYRELVSTGDALVLQVEKAMATTRQNLGSLVLFDDALHHVLKVSRVLELERRSIMLVGVGGSGKKSLAKVAAAVVGACLMHPFKSLGYGVSNFLDDLSAGFKRSGIKGESVCFLISDVDVYDSVFLDYANQQLGTGRISGLFGKEDIESIVSKLRPAFKEKKPGAVDAEDAIMDFFWDRVARHFHFCFCFSPTGDRLSRWTKQFPNLIAACSIDWFHPWPTDALRSLAVRFLPNYGHQVAEAVGQIHALMTQLSVKYFEETGRQVHITPKSYLSFVGSINALCSTKLQALRQTRDSLSLGLQKMASSKGQIDRMKVELEEKQLVLAQSKREIAALIADIDQSTQEATVERRKVHAIVARVTKKAKEIFQSKLEAERDLEAAKPALDDALMALNSITPKDINSLKALRNPPDVIKRIMDCVLILRHMNVGKTSWHEVKGHIVLEASYPEALKMMNDMGFLQKLLNFPKEEINDETVELLQPYFRSDDFNYESARKASGNVAGLSNWAEAMCKYHVVARDVEPKIMRLRESEKELQDAKNEQESAEREKDRVEASLQSLEEKLKQANGDMNRVQRDADATKMKLNNAVTLIESLGGEGARWQDLKVEVDNKERHLVGDCLLACTFTSYLGPISVTHREAYLEATKELCRSLNIAVSDAFHPVSFLTNSADVLSWLEASLPADEVSVQNGALFSSSFQTTRVPYVIDPQGQCIQWVRRMYPDAMSVPFSSMGLMDMLESAVTRGVPIILQSVDTNFGSSLDCVLDQPWDVSGGSTGPVDRYIKIGDKEIEVADGFRVVLMTQLTNPSISPENFAKCTVIDFAVTKSGLEDQFLSFLISRDETELDQKRQGLDEDIRRCEAKMKQLENDLLRQLSSHQGDILEDTHLINVLADTKETTNRVAAQLEEASATKQAVSDTCELYRPCARLAAQLYFALCDFSRLNHMYETSLDQFLGWLDASIDAAPKASTTAGRVTNVMSELKRTVYIHAQYGMFERDKDAWRLFMATVCSDRGIHASRADGDGRQGGLHGDNDRQILRTILSMGMTPIKEKRKPLQWLSDVQWRNALHLQQSGMFGNLLGGSAGLASGAEAKWKAWVNLDEPETAAPPTGAFGSASLHHLALIRALRPDRIKAASRLFVESALGQYFLASKAADLSQIVETHGPAEPIICVISPGADPTLRIHELARRLKKKCFDVSMGQGQEVVARQCLAMARRRGDWVCIQNAHLSCSFLKELADNVFGSSRTSKAPEMAENSGPTALPGTQTAEIEPAFRLWITTEPTAEFPLSLLHHGVRVTFEPPSSVHDALVAILANLAEETLEEVKMPFWKPVLLSLICMHVISQERKRFGPIGWVENYEFSGMDLASSLGIVSNHLFSCQRKAKSMTNDDVVFNAAAVDWKALQYLISVIQYGGRIVDERDQRLMDALTKRFISPELCDGGVVTLLDPRRYPKIHHLYKLRVDSRSTLEDLVNEVDALPTTDIPEIFGLDGGAQRVALELAGKAMFDSLGKVVGQGGDRIHTGDKGDGSSAMGTLRGHPETCNPGNNQGLIDVQTIPSEALRAVYRMELSRGPSLRQRDQLRSAIAFKGRCVHLGAVSSPKALLNGILQDFSRNHTTIAVDELEIDWTVTKLNAAVVREAPKEGVYLWGLVLEGGAIWDEQRNALKLCNTGSLPSGSSPPSLSSVQSKFPVVHATAVEKGKRKRSSKRTFKCPVYVNRLRKAAAFVDFVELEVDGGLNSDELVQRGVALVVDDSYG